MQGSKKAAAVTLLIVLFVAAFLFALLTVRFSPSAQEDNLARDGLAGSIDTLIIGASQAQCAFDTEILDKWLSSNSYNLAHDSLKDVEKMYILDKELNRNPVNTVLIEVSTDYFSQDRTITQYTEPAVFSSLRITEFFGRLKYISLLDKSVNRSAAYSSWISGVSTTGEGYPSVGMKGSRYLDPTDRRLDIAEVPTKLNSERYHITDLDARMSALQNMIDLCKAKNAAPIIVVVPISDNFIWTLQDWDVFEAALQTVRDRTGVTCLDFNLLASRYELFSDEDCYSSDTHHLSKKGAGIFTEVLGECLTRLEKGEDISDMFVASYADIKARSPYMDFMQAE